MVETSTLIISPLFRISFLLGIPWHTTSLMLVQTLLGTYEVFVDDADGWTVCTDDGLPSAQWENMILITETGNEILTY